MKMGNLEYEFMMRVLSLYPAMTVKEAGAILSAWRKRVLR